MVLLLFCLGMDTVIDTVDICNGDWSYKKLTINPVSPFQNVREHDDLFTGSYFEAQTNGDFEVEFLPFFVFQLIPNEALVQFFTESRKNHSLQLLNHSLISLPPPTTSFKA
ncbi:hypothetical protein [Leptospira yasudae]|uniref:Uncharacterized protein n=1 Tax=Leptospira yasudae TaxID=2202201 RepID=A0A6N4QQ06_9LEPT|nr:hypothetical protein [Leptospira yasudae]TGL73914.1 hypothetical protein EHQ72_18795 [Leptospira yasudae]TGL79495.1 hypothetical protein EHQ77_10675 [Leptospira yasudae]TGL90027.1 hypothetical protein EHQ83_00245 [Leptospira yasudae]